MSRLGTHYLNIRGFEGISCSQRCNIMDSSKCYMPTLLDFLAIGPMQAFVSGTFKHRCHACILFLPSAAGLVLQQLFNHSAFTPHAFHDAPRHVTFDWPNANAWPMMSSK